MKEKNMFIKKLRMFMILLVLCLAVLPGNVDAKAKAKAKTVKIHSFTSGDKKTDKKVRSVIKKYIKPKMSTAERVKAIHDYIILNCEYDYSNYLKGKIPYVSYTPKGVLIKKKAVCQGYAETFKVFMDALGIPCKMVIGTAGGGGHAWNMVKINKKWYQIDLTWDDPVPDEKGRVLYNYFLITDKQMRKDHKWKSSTKCKTSNNKFITLLGEVSKTKESATDAFYNGYKNSSNKTATIIVPKKLYNKSNSFVRDLRDNIIEKYNETIMGWSVTTSEYGSYYILTIQVLSIAEQISSDASPEE